MSLDRRQVLGLAGAGLAIGAAPRQTPRMRHGINPSFHGPSSRAIVFGDAFQRARELDPTGTRLFSDVSTPAGTWVVRWEGAGTVQLLGDLVELERGAGRAVYDVGGSRRAVFARWSGTVGRIRVWLPGHEEREFYRPHLDLLRSFSPASIRSLDWTRVNEGYKPEGHGPTQWAVGPAAQVAIANRVGCGLHYQVPLGAPEDWYLAELAPLAHLRGECTIECGNELWNADFAGWRWLDREARARGLRVVDVAAAELDRIFALVGQVLPSARHYVGGQLQNPWFLDTVASLMSARVDACGPAAYLRPRDLSSPLAFVQSCRSGLAGVTTGIIAHRRIADRIGARLEVYEAGQHPTSGGPIVAAAQRLPEMGILYRDLAGLLELEGVDRVSWYSLMTSFDLGLAPFGLLESMDTTTPKADVVRSLSLAAG